MNIAKGFIVDIVKKRIFKGEVYYTNIIHNVVEKDVDENQYIMPGFVNAHVHIESSMLTPLSFSEYALKHGTIAVVTDPHEIANVCGIDGINFMVENAKLSPLKIFFTVPSCVPATNFETSGAKIDSNIVCELLQDKEFVALSEMMNYPGVINDDTEVWNKIRCAKKYNKPIDGHAPLLKGEQLKKYIDAGISTDHECSSLEEATEKIKLGMKIQIREGSAAKNFESLYSLINLYPDNIMLCTDDSHPDDLIKGHMNLIVQKALKKQLKYFNVLRASSYNAIKHYQLPVGLLQKNDPADFIICEDQFAEHIIDVIVNGISIKQFHFADNMKKIVNNWNPSSLSKEDLHIPYNKLYHVIECYDGELLTRDLITKHEEVFNNHGELMPGYDKIVVINRYSAEAKPIVGLIKGFYLEKGALGSTVAHDSHNIIIVGHDDDSILNVYQTIYNNKGGLAVSVDNLTYDLPLPIAGLMSNASAKTVAEKYHFLESFAKYDLKTRLSAPFMTLSFMALLVIPEIKIGDKGLFKINDLQFVPVSFSQRN